VLGIYYLSLALEGEPGEDMTFGSVGEVVQALDAKVVTLHSKIHCRVPDGVADNPDGRGEPIKKFSRVSTTPGRMLLYQILPDHPNLKFDRVLNRLLTKREITNVVDEVYRHCGQKETVIFADRLMLLGFGHAAKAGISFGKDDMVIPATKDKHQGHGEAI